MKKHIHGGDVYRHQNVIDFSANCNPLGTPDSVKRAVTESMEQVYHYPDVRCQKLRDALSAYEEVPADWIICGNGAADLIFSLVLALKPKRALLPAPTFAEYEQALESVGCQVLHAAGREEDGFAVDQALLQAIDDTIDILFLCNPNNPTGILTEPERLEQVMDACRSHGVFLVLDECFLDFVCSPGKYTQKPSLEKRTDLFILKAFTKRYAMAGIRLGYGLCSSRDLLEKMKEVTQPWNVSTLAQAAGIAALKEKEYVDRATELIHRERGFLKEKMREAGLRVYDSQANYIFFKGPENLQELCLQEGLLIRDCGNYYGLARGYYRIAVRTHEENLTLMRAFEKVL
ncbi:threonine-phosphate decarboxylase CobD [Lactonifactor longoviformis]|uniref:threonine-phosphate decarboxylase CobD n=1 Tax=Lactonifactor longoviformis TaxID=341220 RepID=UPI0036F338EB